MLLGASGGKGIGRAVLAIKQGGAGRLLRQVGLIAFFLLGQSGQAEAGVHEQADDQQHKGQRGQGGEGKLSGGARHAGEQAEGEQTEQTGKSGGMF